MCAGTCTWARWAAVFELPSAHTHTHTKFAYFNCLLFSHRLLLLIRYCASGKQRLFVVERVSGRDGVTEMTARRREIYWFDARPTGIRSLLIRAWSHHASVYGCSSSSCNKQTVWLFCVKCPRAAISLSFHDFIICVWHFNEPCLNAYATPHTRERLQFAYGKVCIMYESPPSPHTVSLSLFIALITTKTRIMRRKKKWKCTEPQHHYHCRLCMWSHHVSHCRLPTANANWIMNTDSSTGNNEFFANEKPNEKEINCENWKKKKNSLKPMHFSGVK